MEEIKISTRQDGKQVVSAKELYDFLGFAPQHWAKWHKKNIIKNEFAIYSEDWSDLPLSGRTVDFAITLDFAKRLSMLARTEKGEKVRGYFIQCEKAAQQKTALPSRKELAQMIIDIENDKERLQVQTELQQKELKEAAPKVKYCDEVLSSSSTLTTTIIAKEFGMGAKSFNQLLNKHRIIYKQNGTWVLYFALQNKGLAKNKTYTYTDSEGRAQTSVQLVWTESGRNYLHNRLSGILQTV